MNSCKKRNGYKGRNFCGKYFFVLMLAIFFFGCQRIQQVQTKNEVEFQVNQCQDFEIDGKLSSPEWKKAAVWKLARPLERPEELGPNLIEPGDVRMLHSRDYIYVGITMEDSDIVQQGTHDQMHFYTMGDTIELFFKPEDDTYYWEMYGTPNELRTNFFYPSRSYVFLPGSAAFVPEFTVKAQIDGEFNNWRQSDRGWTIEFKLPKRTLEQYGAKFQTGHRWRFLIARQNYSRKLPIKEVSTVPAIQIQNLQMIQQYGLLKL